MSNPKPMINFLIRIDERALLQLKKLAKKESGDYRFSANKMASKIIEEYLIKKGYNFKK